LKTIDYDISIQVFMQRCPLQSRLQSWLSVAHGNKFVVVGVMVVWTKVFISILYKLNKSKFWGFLKSATNVYGSDLGNEK